MQRRRSVGRGILLGNWEARVLHWYTGMMMFDFGILECERADLRLGNTGHGYRPLGGTPRWSVRMRGKMLVGDRISVPYRTVESAQAEWNKEERK